MQHLGHACTFPCTFVGNMKFNLNKGSEYFKLNFYIDIIFTHGEVQRCRKHPFTIRVVPDYTRSILI